MHNSAVTYLQGKTIPRAYAEILQKGPKYCIEPRVAGLELLDTIRHIADKAPSQERTRCISEGVDWATHNNKKEGPKRNILQPIVDHFRAEGLTLLQSDKEGSFVVLSKDAFNEKALDAINKNFMKSKKRPTRAKSDVLKLLHVLNFDRLEKAVNSSKGDRLHVFFTAKTHKIDCPLRTVITERGSWQKVTGQFLKSKLSTLEPRDPFSVGSSHDLTAALKGGDHGANA
ncbi:hypothetical protein V5799_027886, partial [Amblyomma americanum]